MAVISIVGAPGVGKSFLVKQLSCKLVLPALFEGEEGTLPCEILQELFSKKDPTFRYQWFIDHYQTILERARIISNAGVDCLVDAAAVMALPPWFIAEQNSDHILLNAVKQMKNVSSDQIIVLTAHKEKLREMIQNRGRSHEKIEQTLQRALAVQKEFLKLAKTEKGVIVIDRTNLDFTKEKDLSVIVQRLKEYK